MSGETSRSTLLQIPLIEEKYGKSFLVSIAFHGILILLLIFGDYLVPQKTIQIGSGPGGGTGGDISTVGVVDDLSGGAGMIKPSLVPQPPALLEKAPENKSKAISLPGTVEEKKKPEIRKVSKRAKEIPPSNIIPTDPEPGSGGIAGGSGGSGGGSGAGNGVSIGAGSGGIGDHPYVRLVEQRIGKNWSRPLEGTRVDMIYSFYIAPSGTIYGIKMEKSSGNTLMDMRGERAIRNSNPLNPPPRELRGKIKFVSRFIYPPNP